MAQEIEKKFVVTTLPHTLVDGERLHQGYLSSNPAVRVRLAVTEPPQGWLTVKGAGLLTRAEFEYPIPASDAEQMLSLCETSIEKTRYYPYPSPRWTIDRFHGVLEGLWLAEIELESEGETPDLPYWLRGADEVTYDARFTNVALARIRREHGELVDPTRWSAKVSRTFSRRGPLDILRNIR